MGQTPVVAMMILALAGCGGSSSTKPTAAPATPTHTQPLAKPAVAPDDPKLAFAKVVFAELAAGQVEALVKLADPLAVLEKTADCKVVKSQKLNIDPKQAPVRAARDAFSRSVDKTRDLKIEVLALAPQPAPLDVKTGTEVAEGCVAKRDLKYQAISVKIRAQRDNKPAIEQTATIRGIELDGRWYLIEVPSRIQEKETAKAMRDALAKMTELTDAMCKCKDKACADKVQDDLIKWATEMAKTANHDEQPDPELAKQAAEIMTRYTECMTKIMMGS